MNGWEIRMTPEEVALAVAEAKRQLIADDFKLAVEAAKVRIRERRARWFKWFPWRLSIVRR